MRVSSTETLTGRSIAAVSRRLAVTTTSSSVTLEEANAAGADSPSPRVKITTDARSNAVAPQGPGGKTGWEIPITPAPSAGTNRIRFNGFTGELDTSGRCLRSSQTTPRRDRC